MKYLIKPIASQQDLEDLRTEYLNHSEICVKHTANQSGCFYPSVQVGKDTTEAMLCVSTEAEAYTSAEDIALLVNDLPSNFDFDEDIIEA